MPRSSRRSVRVQPDKPLIGTTPPACAPEQGRYLTFLYP